MMRSLYAGVSGLQNHQTRMDVIGNNISNVNTVGFKKSRVNFQDMISQSIGGAAAPNEVRGGINPKQVGLGMSVASIDTIHTQGAFQSTGVVTDVAISGEGFFIMSEGENSFYTRNGAFDVDKDGILVNPANGMRVMGWQTQNIEGTDVLSTADDLTELYIPIGQKDPARQTGLVELSCNLNKNTLAIENPDDLREVMDRSWVVNKTIFDSAGNEHDLRVTYTRVPDQENQWLGTVEIDPMLGQEAVGVTVGGEGATNTFTVQFDNYGVLQSVTDGNGVVDEEGELNLDIAYTVVQSGPDEDGNLQRLDFTLKLGEIGNTRDSMTQYADTSTTKAFRQDGYGLGYMDSFRIDDAGQITGVFSNGNRRVLGQIALATFTNPEGLEKAGDNTYVVSNNSGDALIGPAGIAGKGKFLAGSLEMSNVDLAESFTDMIVTQRGFQANSRSITTSDQMLQELLTLKR